MESQELEYNPTGKLYFSTIAHVTSFRKNLYYDACATPNCLKKVRENEDGFYCDKCGRDVPEPLPRFMATVKLSDHTGSMWVTVASDAVGEEVFDMDVSTVKAKFVEN